MPTRTPSLRDASNDRALRARKRRLAIEVGAGIGKTSLVQAAVGNERSKTSAGPMRRAELVVASPAATASTTMALAAKRAPERSSRSNCPLSRAASGLVRPRRKPGGPSRTPVRLLGGFCRLHARGVEVFDGRSFSDRPLLGNPLPSDLASGGFRRRHVVFVPQGRWRLRWASCGFASLLRPSF